MTVETNTDVLHLTREFSSGVANEIVATADSAAFLLKKIRQADKLEEYLDVTRSAAPMEYAAMVEGLGQNLKVLDIGVGSGASSAFLASLGHRVWAVEPSGEHCQVVSELKTRFNLSVTAVCTVGEEINKLQENEFDIAFFNASLHHCDDPVLALKNVLSKLKKGGQLFLSAESILRPWKSKKVWYERLQTHPQEMGHYGGNEHIYYSWEYVNMMKAAGFSKVEIFPSVQFKEPLQRIEFEFKTRDGQGRTKMSQKEFLIRTAYYFVMAQIVKLKFIFKPLAAMSILPGQIKGVKS